MKRPQQHKSGEVAALKVNQWLGEWEDVRFIGAAHRRRPDSHFYLFTLSASELKALSGIHRRTTKDGLPRSRDLGIQRRHDEERSAEIREFVHYGYPWSELSKAKRRSGKYDDLRNPGWLPTAVVVNILKPGDKRRGREVADEDVITVVDDGEAMPLIRFPEHFTGPGWEPRQLHPVEVIDGQHRLWAFENHPVGDSFQLPVVAFHGLDISWQAYLFWTINIKPKRINASLAFDLYPLLRTEEWLHRFDDRIYRQTRAQELTEALWMHPESPWYQRINMLGEPGLKMVSQSAWIHALIASYVKAWEGRGVRIGGLFGAPVGQDEEVLPWSRAQQAAFLILVWRMVRDAIGECTEEWAESLRNRADSRGRQDLAFSGSGSLLNTDQGVRGILYLTNDLCYLRADALDLEGWWIEQDAGAADEKAVTEALQSLQRETSTMAFLREIAEGLSKFDWRTSKAEGLSEEERVLKLVFRGSGGYRELRRQLLKLLLLKGGAVGEVAERAFNLLGFDENA
jgi:hypothetical protein